MSVALTMAFLLGDSWIFTAKIEAFFGIVLISMRLVVNYDGKDNVRIGSCSLEEVLKQEKCKILYVLEQVLLCHPVIPVS